MSNEVSCDVVYTWELKNFNIDCLGVELWSPVFKTEFFGNYDQWRLGVCVERYGQNSANFFNSRLKCISYDKKRSEIDCAISILDTDGSLVQTTDITTWNFSNSAYCVFHDLKLSQELFSPSEGGSFHHLTVRCHMKGIESCYGDSVASTLIERCSFPWILENFLQLQPDQSSKMLLVQKDSDGTPTLQKGCDGIPTIFLKLYFGDSGRLHITVCGPEDHGTVCDSDPDTWSASFRLNVLDTKKKMFCPYDSFSFCKDHPLSLKRGMCRDDFLSMGVLTFLMECFFVVEVDDSFPYQELLAVKDTKGIFSDVFNYQPRFPPSKGKIIKLKPFDPSDLEYTLTRKLLNPSPPEQQNAP